MKQIELPKEFRSRNVPDAIAQIRGNRDYPQITGMVLFWQDNDGVLISTRVDHLPVPRNARCHQPIFAYHIHEGTSCMDPKSHYNPQRCEHPYHAGDMPPLFSMDNGNAYLSFKTDRFKLNEVIGRVVVIHMHQDDFTSQPSGDPGNIIACGRIRGNKTRP